MGNVVIKEGNKVFSNHLQSIMINILEKPNVNLNQMNHCMLIGDNQA